MNEYKKSSPKEKEKIASLPRWLREREHFWSLECVSCITYYKIFNLFNTIESSLCIKRSVSLQKKKDFQFAHSSSVRTTYFFHHSRFDGIKSLPTPYEILKHRLFRREGQ